MKVIRIITINLVILFALLIIIDPFLVIDESIDVKTYRNLGLREFGPNRNLEINPVGHGVDTSLLDSKSYQIKTNQSGFIIGPEKFDTAKFEIIFFGGSTTEWVFVDDSLRFPFLVGKKLNKVTGNAGYGGNHSFHSLINLLGKGLTEKPKTVVWMHAVNDFSLLSKTGSYFVSPANRKVLFEEKPSNDKGFLQRWKKVGTSFVLAAIPNSYKRLKGLSQKHEGNVDEWAGYRDLSHVPNSVILQNYRASLESFVGAAKAHGIDVVLMTQFNRINSSHTILFADLGGGSKYSPEAFIALYSAMNEIIREVARSEDLSLIDLAVLLPDEDRYFYDAVHLTNAGSKQVAAIIYNSLAAQDAQIVE